DNGIQVFTKNGYANTALYQLSTNDKLENLYGPATGRTNYSINIETTVKDRSTQETKTVQETIQKSDRSPYYRNY
ncbi:MAG: hypothetical protein AAFW00_28805, partial [Bacteroidota bacterium]